MKLKQLDREIVTLVATGLSNEEIGKKLFRSHKTIQSRLTNLNFEYDCKNRIELCVKALAKGAINNPFK